MNPTGADAVAAVVARTYRDERARVLATLIRQVGDFQLAEDAVHDAFVSALPAWRRDGIPARPGAWITVAARRHAIDRLRRNSSLTDRAERLAELMRLDLQEHAPMPEPSAIADDRLRLIFTCCHPALGLPSRVALTLRVVGGLTTSEIARAFVVNEPTMGKRIVRAKRKIAEAHIPYRVPEDHDLPDRLLGVLQVVYLIFNEGYAATGGGTLVRGELCDEAIRLGELLCELMPDEAEAWALLALMLVTDARRPARVDGAGGYVSLDDQDRSLWDRQQIADGLTALQRAARLVVPGPTSSRRRSPRCTRLPRTTRPTGRNRGPVRSPRPRRTVPRGRRPRRRTTNSARWSARRVGVAVRNSRSARKEMKAKISVVPRGPIASAAKSTSTMTHQLLVRALGSRPSPSRIPSSRLDRMKPIRLADDEHAKDDHTGRAG